MAQSGTVNSLLTFRLSARNADLLRQFLYGPVPGRDRQQDRTRGETQQLHSTLRKHFESLSPRGREVVARVATGDSTKQIAAKLGLSKVTVKIHRAHAMQMMGAKRLADLVRMVERLRHPE
jgi:FixJ family two-component response regulator